MRYGNFLMKKKYKFQCINCSSSLKDNICQPNPSENEKWLQCHNCEFPTLMTIIKDVLIKQYDVILSSKEGEYRLVNDDNSKIVFIFLPKSVTEDINYVEYPFQALNIENFHSEAINLINRFKDLQVFD